MTIETGTIVSGKITGITDFGAFVDIGNGKSGMIHISEVSTGFVKDIREHLSVGQEVDAKVISVSPEGKISLSISKLEQNSESEKREKPAEKKQENKKSAPKVWTGQKNNVQSGEKQTFEDMMAQFKKMSEDKMSDLKRADSKRGSAGYSRRGKN